MAHELTLRANGRAEMAFVGETPWHGLGQSLTRGASIGVWKKEAGLDWEAMESTAMVAGTGQYDDPIQFPDYKGIYRSDTEAPLAIVGAGFKVVQPGEVLEFFRKLVERAEDGWYIHTAGTLRGGRKVWAMATNDRFAAVGKKIDNVHQNVLLTTALDGSMKTTAVETAVRVVCANTLAMALGGYGAGKVISVSHRSHFDHDDAMHQLGLDRGDTFGQFMERAREMSETPIKLDEARAILAEVFRLDVTQPSTAWLGKLADVGKPQEQSNRGIESILALFQGAGKGSDMKTAKGTRWGLLNAVTEHVDHYMGRTQDTRLDSAWFGRGNTIKTDALQLLAA